MDQQPTHDPRLIEALEACRPHSDDLADPAMAALAAQMAASREVDDLYERLQRFDAAVAKAFCDVPVPVDLGDRILARLAAEPAQPVVPVSSSDEVHTADLRPLAAARPRGTRRTLVAIVAAAIAASIVAALFIHRDQRKPLGSEVCEAAITFYAGDVERGHGSLVGQQSPPAEYPFSSRLRSLGNTRWRVVSDFVGYEAVAYDLKDSDGSAATVYVLRPERTKLRDGEECPPWQTGQQSSVAWREGQLVYVLVVQGGQLDRFFETGGPLT
jgi:hypothetical protein